mmetsp:Transcript_76377/g.210912  ORF Transcript_76377/g.210912 Transcript_76377/m.210912 type:complete len:446 (-) Transcript_76377:1152-2489(-)
MCLRSSSLDCTLYSRLNSWNSLDSWISTTLAWCTFSATYAFISSDCFQRQSRISLASCASSRAFSLISSRVMFHLIWASMARISRTSFLVSSSMRWNSCTDCGCPTAAAATPGAAEVAAAVAVASLLAASAVEFGCPGVRLPRLPTLLDKAIRAAAGDAFAGDCCPAAPCRGLGARRAGLWPGLPAACDLAGGCGLACRAAAAADGGDSGVATPDLTVGLAVRRAPATAATPPGAAAGDFGLPAARDPAVPPPAAAASPRPDGPVPGRPTAGPAAGAAAVAATAAPVDAGPAAAVLGRERWQVVGLGRGLAAGRGRGLTACRCFGAAVAFCGLLAPVGTDWRAGWPAPRWADLARAAGTAATPACPPRGAGLNCCGLPAPAAAAAFAAGAEAVAGAATDAAAGAAVAASGIGAAAGRGAAAAAAARAGAGTPDGMIAAGGPTGDG